MPAHPSELNRAHELYFDRVSQIRMESWSRGRIALVGDAAFCVSLVAGQGSALAMIAAYVLAGELANAGGRHEEAFGKYEAILRAYINTKQQGAERFAAVFAPKTQRGLWFPQQVIRAFAIPGLARLAVGKDIIDTLRLPDFGGTSCRLGWSPPELQSCPPCPSALLPSLIFPQSRPPAVIHRSTTMKGGSICWSFAALPWLSA